MVFTFMGGLISPMVSTASQAISSVSAGGTALVAFMTDE